MFYWVNSYFLFYVIKAAIKESAVNTKAFYDR